ncbi:MAG: hypothetical protein KF814_14205 [Nitrospiraceae bacterium]|nr:hypothetical protein [Nitrospiraceae bacterium]
MAEQLDRQCIKVLTAVVMVAIGTATIFFPSQGHAAGIWTNEPTGASVVLDCPFNSVSGCGILDAYATSQVVPDASAPVSPSNVVKSTLLPGNTGGGIQLNYVTPQVQREMYMGLMWRTNPQFQGRVVGNKMFFLRGPGANGVWLFGNSALVGGTAPMIFAHNTGGLDNSHVCALDSGLACYPNVGDGTLRVGTWTKLEAYVKASTTMTSRDGIVRWWINGVLVGNYTNLNYAQNGLNEWVWAETWDGLVNPPPTVEWNHFLDHLHVSIPNGGGTTDQPPGPPASPSIRGVTVP